jgi:hypothetical protein
VAKARAVWTFSNKARGFERTAALTAEWEVAYDPISNDYTPREMDAGELFRLWEAKARADYPNGLIPIYWSVVCPEAAIAEFMPFQYKHHDGMPDEDFLTFFTWPVNRETGERLNWLSLPVVDKRWNPRHAYKGGFIQEHTGWKPSVLQPYVYLPALTRSLRSY